MIKSLPTVFHKRLSRVEFIDQVTVTTVPRWKTSGLSGDEWRHSALVQFWHKGLLVHEFSRHDVETAISHVPYEMDAFADGAVLTEVGLKHEKTRCDQPGCSAPATVKMYLKEEFSSCGEKLDPADCHMTHWRKFCDEHKHRGDCSREDADDNYIDHESFNAD